jgi:hypothetical protein
LEQPFEDRLEERRVKMAALALKDATDLVEQKLRYLSIIPLAKPR